MAALFHFSLKYAIVAAANLYSTKGGSAMYIVEPLRHEKIMFSSNGHSQITLTPLRFSSFEAELLCEGEGLLSADMEFGMAKVYYLTSRNFWRGALGHCPSKAAGGPFLILNNNILIAFLGKKELYKSGYRRMSGWRVGIEAPSQVTIRREQSSVHEIASFAIATT